MDAVGERPRSGERRRVRARVEGTVQGVGFRPYVYRLARELGLAGFVLNDARGVVLEVEGDAEPVERFLERLAGRGAAAGRASSACCRSRRRADRGARLRDRRERARAASRAPRWRRTRATCDDCLAELFDPADRRHRYPFINCTNCGPRFTIVRGVPYDRPLHDDGRLRDVPGLPGRVRRPGRPALPRPAERLPGLRARRCSCSMRRGWAGRGSRVARGGARAARRRGRGA